MDESLILNQPRGPTGAHLDRSMAIGNRMRRIRDKAIERRLGVCWRLIKRQFTVRMEVEPFRDDVLFRRPFAVFDPLVAAGPESNGLRAFSVALAFQIVGKKRRNRTSSRNGSTSIRTVNCRLI